MAFTDRLANRGSVSTGFEIDHSMKCQANSGNEWFRRDNPTAGNRQTFTFSFWHKRTQLSGYEADNYLMSQGSNARFHFAGHTLRFMFDGNSTELEASGKLRDTSAWYHIVLAVDTTQATNTNRVKMYVNGVSYEFNNSDWPSQNATSDWMNTNDLYFNVRDGDGSYDNSGYWSEVACVDGTQCAPTVFGEFDDDSGIWKPKDLTEEDITWGSQGFYWTFSDTSALGADSSDNSNTATFSNLTTADIATDTPTNNFATFNVNVANSSNCTYSEGGTKVVNGASAYRSFISTIAVTKGKWYAEFNGGNPNDHFGAEVCPVDANDGNMDQSYMSSFTEGIGYYHNGNKYIDNSASSYGNSITNSNLIGCALDMDNGYVYFSKDNTWQNSGDPTSGSSGTGGIALVAASKLHYMGTSNNNTAASYCNFGGFTALTVSSGNADANGYGNFEHAPPSGYYALCTKNLAKYGG